MSASARMRQSPHAARGFTVLELLIAFVIVAILSGLALPAYFQSARKSYRAEAKAIVMENAQYMERYWTTNKFYSPPSGSTIPAPVLVSSISPKGSSGSGTKYNISFTTGQPTATTFVLQAVPINSQASDTCGTLTMSNTGAQTAGASNCW